MIEHGEDFYNCTCPVCGKKFHLKPCAVKRFKIHHCSKECFRIAKKEYMAGSNNHQYGLKGNKNASWRSDKKLSRYGYIQVRQLDHPFRDSSDFVFEHRLVAEQFLLTPECSIEINGKRYLSQNYVVHHRNFDRADNRPENLQVMTKSEHKALHLALNPAKHDERGRFTRDDGAPILVKRVTETAIVPERKSIGAAGYDMYADIQNEVIIPPHETRMIYSGIAFAIPKNYFGAIYARSGIAIKDGLRPATCVSVIDSDFRGNVGLPIHNDTDEARRIAPKERIAQIVFQEALICDLELVDHLDETERGSGGFGSTGR